MDAVTNLPDDELAALAEDTEGEAARRGTIRGTDAALDELCLDSVRALGRVNGGAFAPPEGIVGAYPTGWRVTHGGRVFEAERPGLLDAPPADGWREIADPVGDPAIPFWEPVPYSVGATVRDRGRIYRARIPVDGLRPSDFPAGWDLAD